MLEYRTKTYIVTGLSLTCLISLWLLTGTTSDLYTLDNKNIQSSTKERDVLYRPLPKNKDLCSSESYNSGQWVHQSIGLESHSIEGINQYAGYHCNWDFPHRCYRRQEPITEFNRSKAM
jgi:hypothetical protein